MCSMDRIPKTIHYCWFGRNNLSPLTRKCIKSWKKYCPDYEIREWSEDNFNINSNLYVQQAYEAKKWAFITDYVRLYVLYNYGGIYMDTDVEVVNSIDIFLKHGAFSGFEDQRSVPTAIMGAEKGNKWIERLIEYYDDKSFINKDGSYDLTTNVETITDITRKHYNLKSDNTYQELKDGLVFYPTEYFCPKNFFTGKINVTGKTCTIHHFNSSWLSDKEKLRWKLRRTFGVKLGSFLYRRIYK